MHQACNADLVDHFGQLTGAAGAQQGEGARKRHADRLYCGKCVGITSAHHRQHAVLCTGLAARDGGIHKLQALRLRGGIQLARHLGRGSGVVHEDGAGLHACKCAVTAQRDRAQVVVVADAAKNDIGACGCFSRRSRTARRRGGGKFLAPCHGLGGSSVVHGHFMAGQGQVPSHGVTHHPEA